MICNRPLLVCHQEGLISDSLVTIVRAKLCCGSTGLEDMPEGIQILDGRVPEDL